MFNFLSIILLTIVSPYIPDYDAIEKYNEDFYSEIDNYVINIPQVEYANTKDSDNEYWVCSNCKNSEVYEHIFYKIGSYYTIEYYRFNNKIYTSYESCETAIQKQHVCGTCALIGGDLLFFSSMIICYCFFKYKRKNYKNVH